MLFASIATFLTLATHQVSAGQALLDESAAKLKSTQSITLTMNVAMMGRNMKMPVKIMRGGFIRAVNDPDEEIITPSGGWTLMAAKKQYIKRSASDALMDASKPLPGFEALFEGAKLLVAVGEPTAGKIGDKETTRVAVKDVGMTASGGFLHLDPQTKMPAGFEVDGGGAKFVMSYTDLKVDAGLTAKDFDWSPPAGWTEFKPSPQEIPAQTDFTATLLKIGAKAPSFSLKTPKGTKMSLAKAMEGRKATLVNFWFYG